MEIAIVLSSVLIGAISIYITNKHYKKTQELQDHKWEKELFTEFNQRYDLLNGTLMEVEKLQKAGTSLSDVHRKAINDFFNLCSEEYFWYKRGRINKDIWISWHSGMNYWYNKVHIVQKMWEDEIREDSWKAYYLKKGESFFILKNN